MNDKLILGAIALVGIFVVVCFVIYYFKGKSAVVEFIRRAEYVFDWSGSGKEKMAYVLERMNKQLNAPFKWFADIKLVERLLATLQDEFKEMKEEKKKVEKE